MSSDNRKKIDRRSKLKAASEVLQSLFQNYKSPLSQEFSRWKLWHTWDQVVGETMARSCYPVGYSRGILYVWVDHATRMQELIFLKKHIIDKINKHIGRKWVHSIRFTLDAKDVPNPGETHQGWRDFIGKTPSDGPES